MKRGPGNSSFFAGQKSIHERSIQDLSETSFMLEGAEAPTGISKQELNLAVQKKVVEILKLRLGYDVENKSGELAIQDDFQIDKQTCYSETVEKLKDRLLKILTEERIGKLTGNIKDASIQLKERVVEANLDLFFLIREVTDFLVAIELNKSTHTPATSAWNYITSAWGKGSEVENPENSLLEADFLELINPRSEFNPLNLLKVWKEETKRLVSAVDEKESKIEANKREYQNAVIEASMIVLNDKVNETMQWANESVCKARELSSIMEEKRDIVKLLPLNPKSNLSEDFKKNIELMKEERKILADLEKEHAGTSLKAISKRLEEYLPAKTIYSLLKIFLYVQSQYKLLDIYTEQYQRLKSTDFQKIILSIRHEIKLLKELAIHLGANIHSEKTNEILEQFVKGLDSRKDKTLNLLISNIINADHKDIEPSPKKDPAGLKQFLSNLCKSEFFFPKDIELATAFSKADFSSQRNFSIS